MEQQQQTQQSDTITLPEKGRVMIYACGGAGVNIGQTMLMKYVGQSSDAFADVSMGFINTSVSDFRRDTPKSSCYFIEGVDGSGGIRALNYPEIKRRTKDILQKLRPLDFNIVISSGGGGSGSVIAPCIVEELLKRKLPTVVILVGGADTYKRADNTLKTLQSYELIARNTDTPVCLCYQENSDVTPIKVVNQSISTIVSILTAVFSRRNRRLDMADVANWLNYTKATTHGAQLTALDIQTSGQIDNVDKIITALTLAEEGSFESLDVMVENHYVGFMDKAPVSMSATLPIHCILRTGGFKEITARLKSISDELEEQKNARVTTDNDILDDSNIPDDGGSVVL